MSTFTHINAAEVARKAASDFGLSMKDDPTQWADGLCLSLLQVHDACNEVANSNAKSTLSRTIGKVVEQIAADMEGAIAEDGALADLEGVFAVYVSELKPDFDAVLQAADWETRVEALRLAVAQAIHAQPIYRVDNAALAAYIESDPRLAHLKPLSMAMDPGEIPPHLKRTEQQASRVHRKSNPPVVTVDFDAADDEVLRQVQNKAALIDGDEWDTDAEIASAAGALGEAPEWDDEDPPVNGVGIVEGSVEDWDDNAPAEPKPLFIPDMMQVAGIQDQDGAEIFGMSKSYYSMIRNRKRPWPGIKPDQIERLRVELVAHEQAIAALRQALNDPTLTKPNI